MCNCGYIHFDFEECQHEDMNMIYNEVFNESNDYQFQPMSTNPNWRPRKCRHVGCKNSATQVRYHKDIYNVPDKSSKTFVCEEHLLTKEV